jgi:hypothetical protein
MQQHQWRAGRSGARDKVVGVGWLGHSDVRYSGKDELILTAIPRMTDPSGHLIRTIAGLILMQKPSLLHAPRFELRP